MREIKKDPSKRSRKRRRRFLRAANASLGFSSQSSADPSSTHIIHTCNKYLDPISSSTWVLPFPQAQKNNAKGSVIACNKKIRGKFFKISTWNILTLYRNKWKNTHTVKDHIRCQNLSSGSLLCCYGCCWHHSQPLSQWIISSFRREMVS